MCINKKEFYSEEQWREHKGVLKLPEVRCYYVTHCKNCMLVWYRQGLADNEFMIQYLDEGGTNLFYLHASFDSVKTLKELLIPLQGIKCLKALSTD